MINLSHVKGESSRCQTWSLEENLGYEEDEKGDLVVAAPQVQCCIDSTCGECETQLVSSCLQLVPPGVSQGRQEDGASLAYLEASNTRKRFAVGEISETRPRLQLNRSREVTQELQQYVQVVQDRFITLQALNSLSSLDHMRALACLGPAGRQKWSVVKPIRLGWKEHKEQAVGINTDRNSLSIELQAFWVDDVQGVHHIYT